MKVILFILIFVGVNISSFSQSIIQGNNELFSQDSSGISISTYGRGYYGSNMLTNEFIDVFRLGGYIDSELKDRSFSKANDMNIAGGEGIYGIKFINKNHKLFGNWGYYGELSSYSSGAIQFSKDLYELTFYGNQNLLGDSVFLQQTSFHSREYKKLGFGIINEQFSIGLGIMNFNNNFSGIMQGGYVYTDNAVDEIRMEVNGTVDQSASNRNNQYGHSGFGVGVDFEYKVPKSEFTGDSTQTDVELIVGVKNIGFFVSDKQNVHYHIDTNVVYTGIQVGSISEFSSSFTNNDQVPDSLNITGTDKKISGLLPFEVYFYKPLSKAKKAQPIYGFRYIIQSNYRAFFYLGGSFTNSKKLNLSTYISYGGYNKLLWGLSLHKEFKRLSFGIGSSNLIGLFSPEQFGKGASINLKYNLK